MAFRHPPIVHPDGFRFNGVGAVEVPIERHPDYKKLRRKYRRKYGPGGFYEKFGITSYLRTVMMFNGYRVPESDYRALNCLLLLLAVRLKHTDARIMRREGKDSEDTTNE